MEKILSISMRSLQYSKSSGIQKGLLNLEFVGRLTCKRKLNTGFITWYRPGTCVLNSEQYSAICCANHFIDPISRTSLNNQRWFSSDRFDKDSEELIKILESKTQFTHASNEQLTETEKDINKSLDDLKYRATVTSDNEDEDDYTDEDIDDDNDSEEGDKYITVNVNDTCLKFEVDDVRDQIIDRSNLSTADLESELRAKTTINASDNESNLSLDDDRVLDNDYKLLDDDNDINDVLIDGDTILTKSDKQLAKYRTTVYNEDTSDSDEESSDLYSDSSSDSSSSDTDSESSVIDNEGLSDDEGRLPPTFNTKSSADGNEINFDEIDNVVKEGFTSEEMIKHLEDTMEMEDVDEEMQDETDELLENIDEEEIIDAYSGKKDGKVKSLEDGDPSEDVITSHETELNSDVPSDDTFISAPSRHFDESGVISLIDMNRQKPSSKDWSIEEIEDFVNIATEDVEELPWQPSISLERGKTGVFDIEDLLELIRKENLQDIVTLRIPPENHFGDYMVISTGKSFRHLKAVAESINWIYKKRKNESERFLKQEGKKEDSGWIAMDLGNIILHIFLAEKRALYDLETLWSVGTKYDDQSQDQEDPYALSIEDHPWLKELEDLQKAKMADKKQK